MDHYMTLMTSVANKITCLVAGGPGGLRWIALPIMVAAIGGCATAPTVVLPPVSPTPTNDHRVGKVVWHDLLTHDLAAVQQFYSELFGWQFQGTGNDTYTVINHNGRAIGGVVYVKLGSNEPNRSQWVSYLSVSDVDRAAQQVREAGGVIHTEPVDFPERGRLTVVSDPQGALIALVRSTNGDPLDMDPPINEWMWAELWTTDLKAAGDFYQALVGYEFDTRELYEETTYHVFQRDGKPRAGVIEIEWQDIPPNWLAYVRVEDPAAIAARVESLGGHVFLAPDDNIRNGDVAIIVDPSGAALTVQRWPPRSEEGGDVI
jgi:predicted enzyme related to lactoylglutathione lyase